MNTRRRLKTVLVALIAAASTAVVAAGAGCNGSSGPPRSAPPGGEEPCPATLEATLGAACAVDGLVCGPTYPCGSAQIPLLCVCDGRAFQCTDGAGNPVDTADAISCTVSTDAGSSCPRTESAAPLAPCSASGRICAYPSSCPNTFDQCECFPGTTADGGFGLRFECRPSVCVSSDGATAVVTDAGPGDADAADSNLDVESGPSEDSASDANASPDADSASEASAGPHSDSASSVDSNGDAPSESDSSTSDARPD
jgi:hypothetical protein